MINYVHYRLSIKEILFCCLRGSLLCIVTGLLFFKSLRLALLLLPYLLIFLKKESRKRLRARKERLNEEFRDFLCGMASAVEAGYSAEKALPEAKKDLQLVYGEKSLMQREISYMQRRLENGVSIEESFKEFAVRSGDEDITDFSEVFQTAKRMGGDILRVINSVADTIHQKQAVRKEIKTQLAAKSYELAIMKLMPIIILSYLLLTCPMFIEPLYSEPMGRGIMTLTLIVWRLISIAAEKILCIEI